MKTAITFVFLFFSFFSIGQGWEMTFDLGNQEELVDAVQTADGDLWVCGNVYIDSLGKFKIVLHQVSETGEVKNEFSYLDSTLSVRAQKIAQLDDGSLIVLGLDYPNFFTWRTEGNLYMLKISSTGQLLEKKLIDDEIYYLLFNEIVVADDGVLIGGRVGISGQGGVTLLLKLDFDLNIQWQQFVTHTGTNPCGAPGCWRNESIESIIETDDRYILYGKATQLLNLENMGRTPTLKQEGFARSISKTGNSYPRFFNEDHIFEFVANNSNGERFGISEEGHFLKIGGVNIAQASASTIDDFDLKKILFPNTSELVFAGRKENKLSLKKVAKSGVEIWERTFKDDVFKTAITTSDNGFLLVGNQYIAKTDSLGYVNSGKVKGYIYHDENGNCQKDSSEIGVYNQQVNFKGNSNFSLTTDRNGFYEILLDTGFYEISTTLLDSAWVTCEPIKTIDFKEFHQDTIIDFFARDTCPDFTWELTPLPICGEGEGKMHIEAFGGTGNFSFEWSNGNTGPVATNLSSGNYSVSIYDNHCLAVDDFEYEFPETLQMLPEIIDACRRVHHFDFSNEKWEGYEFHWEDGTIGAVKDFFIGEDTTIVINVISPEGCEGQIKTEVDTYNDFGGFEITKEDSHCGISTGTISFETFVSDGTLNFIWENGDTITNRIWGLSPEETYSLTVTNGTCFGEFEFEIGYQSPNTSYTKTVEKGGDWNNIIETDSSFHYLREDEEDQQLYWYSVEKGLDIRNSRLEKRWISNKDLEYIYQMSDEIFLMVGEKSGDLILNTYNRSRIFRKENIIDSNSDLSFSSLVVLENGGAILLGKIENASTDLFVAFIDETANVVWSKTYGGSGEDLPVEIISLNETEVLIGSTSNSTNRDIVDSHGGNDYWLLKIDIAGNILYSKNYGGSNNEDLKGLAVSQDTILLWGRAASSDGQITNKSIGWGLKLDLDGNIIQDQKITHDPDLLKFTVDKKFVGLSNRDFFKLDYDWNYEIGGPFTRIVWTGNNWDGAGTPFLLPTSNGGFLCPQVSNSHSIWQGAPDDPPIFYYYSDEYLRFYPFFDIPSDFEIRASDTLLCLGDTIRLETDSLLFFKTTWSNNIEGSINVITQPGVYSATLHNQASCRKTQTISILPCNFSLKKPKPLCNEVELDAGIVGAKYLWSNGDETQISKFTETGFASVQVTFPDGTIFKDSVFVEIAESTIQSNIIASDTICYASSTGFIDLEILPNSDSLTFFWSNGSTTQNLENIQADHYFVTITELNGCESFSDISITEHSEILTNPITKQLRCFYDSTGHIDLNPIGGLPPYQYKWSSGQTDSIIKDLPAGEYYFTITDANDCEFIESATIANDSIIVDLKITHPTNGQNNGSIGLNYVAGGRIPYSFNVDITNLNNLPPGAYQIIVTDRNGCTVETEVILIDPTSSNLDIEKDFQLKISPNPFQSEFLLEYELAEADEISIDLLNTLSQKVISIFEKKRQQPGRHQLSIPAKNLSEGTYLLSFKTSQKLYLRRIIKANP